MLAKKVARLFIPSEIAVLAASYIHYHDLSLVHYINTSFFIGGLFLFFSLTIFILSSGFFDRTANGFRKTFTFNGKGLSKEELNEMKPLSELIAIPFLPSLLNGVLLMAVMMVCLWIYYL
ncbi:DUF3899 domain-containing protein [Falsibacillus pallidus]|uniref:DUF3899 domain-containing protein n=1 Tax=Falsibacillus pallidus TaxID=493781 RepID=UPI003D977E40